MMEHTESKALRQLVEWAKRHKLKKADVARCLGTHPPAMAHLWKGRVPTLARAKDIKTLTTSAGVPGIPMEDWLR